VAKGEPDGYTILVNASAHSAAPAAYPHIPYDTIDINIALAKAAGLKFN
jgi:hypothetical protein